MPAYSILAVTPVTESWIADYVPTTSALIAKHGGKYLARTASHETLEGDGQLAALPSSSNGLPERPRTPS